MEVMENLYKNKFIPRLNTSFYHLPSFKSKIVKNYTLPIVIHREDDWFVAECPLFYVASQGRTMEEVLINIKSALRLYLSSEKVQKNLPEKLTYSEEDMIQKAIDLFIEYNLSDDELPEYFYKEIKIDVLINK